MVVCLERCADNLHMVQLIPLPPDHLCFFSKIQNGLFVWHQLIELVLGKGRYMSVVVVVVL